MNNMFPDFLIPLWILGVPLILAIIDRMRTPASNRSYSDRSHRVHATA